MNNILVSVIIPIYNCEDFIENTILSIKNQTFKDFEVLLIDDKSEDNSLSIIINTIGEDERFKIIKLKENSGAAVARNTGIENANGKYIAFLDSDDLWHKDKLNIQVDFMEKNGYDFSYTAYNKIDENTKKNRGLVKSYGVLSYKDMLKANFIGCSTVMYNQKNLGKVYMPLIRTRQDYGLWLKILKVTENAYGINKPLTDYMVRSNSISSNKAKLLKNNYKLFREIEGFSTFKSLWCLSNNIFYKLFIKR